MNLLVRLHDAVDDETVLQRLLPVLAHGGRRVAYAAYDDGAAVLVRRWSAAGEGGVDEARLELEPARLHALLADDAGGDRPLRPVDSAAAWVLKDLLPGIEPEKHWVRARAVAHDGRWLGVFVVAEPRRRMLARRSDDSMDAGGDVLELCLSRALLLRERQEAEAARAHALRSLAQAPAQPRDVAEARRDVESMRARMEALEQAAASATEMLMEAHVEIDRRAQRHQRQTRVLYLLRKLLERSAHGMGPAELADEVVKTVSEAFGGSRCSLLLIDEHGGAPELRLCAAVGLPPMIDSDRVRIPLGRGISGAVASSRMPLVVRDPDEGVTHPLMRDAWYTGPAFVSLPLLCRGRLLGVLNLSNFRAGTVDDYEVEQLRLVALCVGLLADHAGLNDRLFAGLAA
ncbi:GAF domain-containing protein [Longimicrobium sp.]|uniref:GAF domain-containing protein n=1 Tax=Longimicrobium sp. TaxID=2029185 RepID=UPI002BB37BCD|nr:GAF domain-containing protein [Longimicrobium sp.]HSU15810.1 GAF domain-containing protein [Longimicrobium sp.]